jgi:medium-chain acyl-[acyl-carrier-protein] hydrolase
LETELLPFFNAHTLCYPGRGTRFSEKLQDSFEYLVSDMVALLKKENFQASNFFFLGHSFGSLVLFETMRELRRLGLPLPDAIYLSGRKAPSIPYTGKYWSTESDLNFTELLISKGGIPQELYQNKEFLDFFLPIIRSDFKLLEGYQYVKQDPFDIPFHVINGTEDQSISEADTQDWQKETTIGCQFKKMKGSHFYLLDNTADFVKTIFGGVNNN